MEEFVGKGEFVGKAGKFVGKAGKVVGKAGEFVGKAGNSWQGREFVGKAGNSWARPGIRPGIRGQGREFVGKVWGPTGKADFFVRNMLDKWAGCAAVEVCFVGLYRLFLSFVQEAHI